MSLPRIIGQFREAELFVNSTDVKRWDEHRVCSTYWPRPRASYFIFLIPNLLTHKGEVIPPYGSCFIDRTVLKYFVNCRGLPQWIAVKHRRKLARGGPSARGAGSPLFLRLCPLPRCSWSSPSYSSQEARWGERPLGSPRNSNTSLGLDPQLWAPLCLLRGSVVCWCSD